jgi:hypothetical protein
VDEPADLALHLGWCLTAYHPMNHQPEVEDIDREDMPVEVGVVEREHKGMVLMRHWTDDGAGSHR